MKMLFSIIIGIIVFAIIILWIDPMIISIVMKLIPESAHEWFGLIKLGLWIILLVFTLGLTFTISFIVASVAYMSILRDDQTREDKKHNDRIKSSDI